MRLLVATALAGLVAMGPQNRKDFSGHWVLETSGAGPETPRVMVIKQESNRLNALGEASPSRLWISIPSKTAAGRQTTKTREIYVGQGYIKACTTAVPNCNEFGDFGTTWDWDNDKLIFSDRTYTGRSFRTGSWKERHEAWSIAPDEKLVVEVSTESWKSAPRTVTFQYKRQLK